MAVRGVDDADFAEVDSVLRGDVTNLRFGADEDRRNQSFRRGFEGAGQ